MSVKFAIISYSDELALPTAANHQYYADLNQYTYILDVSPCAVLDESLIPRNRQVYFSKLQKVRKFLPYFDWILWIDDDAVFSDLSVKLEEIVEKHMDVDFLICNSPTNTEGIWTFVNSGVFLIRNTKNSLNFLSDCLNSNLAMIKDNWNSEKMGYFTNADQDAIAYNLLRNPKYTEKAGFWRKLDFTVMNSRFYHYRSRLDEHFILHFAGCKVKLMEMQNVADQFQVDLTFLPDNAKRNYSLRHNSFAKSKMNFERSVDQRKATFLSKIVNRIAKMLKY